MNLDTVLKDIKTSVESILKATIEIATKATDILARTKEGFAKIQTEHVRLGSLLMTHGEKLDRIEDKIDKKSREDNERHDERRREINTYMPDKKKT